jgi:hypothetical protein
LIILTIQYQNQKNSTRKILTKSNYFRQIETKDFLRLYQENEPKESARVPRILRVVDTAGARGNSPRLRQGYGGTQTGPRALIRPHRRCSARDKGDNVNIIKAR